MPSPLPTRRLGAHGPEITVVGFGAWAIGGGDWAFGWGPQDDRHSIAAIHRGLELGIDWIDTAAAYGLGHSEEIVARALSGVAERPLVFTKCGMVWHDQADGVPRPNLRPEEIRRGCDESLRRLGVERIDLLQFHWPDPNTGTPVEESWGAMADLVAAGKVRWAGVSNFDVALLERCEPILHVDSLQPPFNAIDRAAAAELLPWCAAHGTGVLVYSPMMSGLLTGRFSRARAAALDDADWRTGFPPFIEPALSRNLALADALSPVAERHATSVAAVAVAWTLAWPGVSAAIVGARAPDQVDGWIGAADLTLTEADLDEIAAAIAATGAGEGRVNPHAEEPVSVTADDLRRSRELLDTIIACAPLGFALFDREMRYVRVNQALAQMHGMPEEDHIGKRPSEIVPDLTEQVLGVFRRVVDAEESVEDVEVSGHIPSDPDVEHHLLLTWYPVRDEGEVVGVGVFVTDITARVRAERGLKLLADVGEALDTALGVEERLERLAELVVPTLADFCTIDRVAADGSTHRVAGAHVDPARAAEMRERSGAPADEATALIEAPLIARGRMLGTLTLGNSVSGRRYDERDATLIRQLSWRAGLAIDNARLYDEQRHIAATLQRGILPPALPEIPGVEAAARFSPMGDGLEVGGDFYDLFAVNDAWVAVMGDVCGKGVEAAALTSLARHGIRAISRGGPAPSAVLSELNEVIVRDRGLDSRFSTVAYARLVMGAGAIVATVASAGHPLPLIVRAGGRVETLGEPGMLLGPFAEIRVTDRSGELRPGDALVLFTDGVTEARRGGEMFGEGRLRELLARQAGRTADEIAEALEGAVVGFHGGPLDDDLAVLVLRVLDRPLR